MLIRLSQPDSLIVSLADVKKQAVIDTTDDDDLLTAYIKAATRLVEDRTGRILVPTEFEWRADAWNDGLVIPVVPLRTVTEIVYLDEDHVQQTLSADWYSVESETGFEIRYNEGFTAPAVSSRSQAVRVQFAAGFDDPTASGSGDDPQLAQDPADRIIVMMLVAHWYGRRELVAAEATSEVPFSADMLISTRRIYR